MRGSRHGKCREMSGEFLMFLLWLIPRTLRSVSVHSKVSGLGAQEGKEGGRASPEPMISKRTVLGNPVLPQGNEA